jgi:hypothetical protein
VGLGTVANVGRELGLIGAQRREALLWEAGRLLAEGRAAPQASQGPARRAKRAKRKA